MEPVVDIEAFGRSRWPRAAAGSSRTCSHCRDRGTGHQTLTRDGGTAVRTRVFASRLRPADGAQRQRLRTPVGRLRQVSKLV
jgi:hypothetical protein